MEPKEVLSKMRRTGNAEGWKQKRRLAIQKRGHNANCLLLPGSTILHLLTRHWVTQQSLFSCLLLLQTWSSDQFEPMLYQQQLGVRAFLVVQWLRICLPVQGTEV